VGWDRRGLWRIVAAMAVPGVDSSVCPACRGRGWEFVQGEVTTLQFNLDAAERRSAEMKDDTAIKVGIPASCLANATWPRSLASPT
jgi:hypothetical protein